MAFARDHRYVFRKIKELERYKMPYVIICGERIDHNKVVYRPPKGKYDALKFSLQLIPKDTDIVALNDVDTEIYNLEAALDHFKRLDVALVFAEDIVKSGPQVLFHQFLFSILRVLPILANGDLMLIKRHVLEKIDFVPCKAEDTYILFRVLELGYRAVFCEECHANTEKTETENQEEIYKRRTVTGIYQALSYTTAPPLVRVFYILLPFASPLLLCTGRRGYSWMKGILSGFLDYLRGDNSGVWQSY